MIIRLFTACFTLLSACPLFAEEQTVTQSAREVPIACEVDLLVVGGSSGGVAAACEAARAGAKVMLVTQYPYLGEDRTATLRLGGEPGEDADDPLAVMLMDDPHLGQGTVGILQQQFESAEKYPFTYTTDGKIDPSHPEIAKPGRLADGRFLDPINESLQINGDATITVDLSEPKEIRQILLSVWHRSGGNAFKVEKVECRISEDGEQWKPAPGTFSYEEQNVRSEAGSLVFFSLTVDEAIKVRYLNIKAIKDESCKRILLGELLVLPKPLSKPTASNDDGLKLPRPMHVKRVLDNVLLEANIPFLLNTFKVGDITDENGTVFGAVIASRSGRQAVLAKKVLDTRPKNNSLAKAQFVVIGAAPKEIDLKDYPLLKSCTTKTIGEPFIAAMRNAQTPQLTYTYPVVNYSFGVGVPENTKLDDISFLAEVEKQIRLATYSPDQAFTADEIYYSRDFKPLSAWRDIGRKVAERTKSIETPSTNELFVVGENNQDKSSDNIVDDVREVSSGLRAEILGVEVKEKAIVDPERKLPVLGKYDVVVVGGGTSGAPAGIAAARQGARTLVLEHLHDLGGIGTAGAITGYWYGNVVGFTKEVLDGRKGWSIESKTHWWRSKLAEAGADVWYGVLAGGALVENGRVKGVLIATPFGSGIVEAEVVIDATGNGDIAIAVGAEIQSYDNLEVAVQGAGLPPRNLGVNYTNTDFLFVDDGDVIDSSHAFIYSKQKYPKAFDQGKLLATRERRQIQGEFSFGVLDQVNHRTYPDTIVTAYSDYDIHGFTVDPYMELNHPYYNYSGNDHDPNRPDRLYVDVPCRSSIPKGLDGILVTGLAMSSHRDALPIVRMQADLQNQGYAIGCAAALLSKKSGMNVRDLDIRNLQKHLVEIGNLKPEVLKQVDNYGKTRDRLPAAIDSLPEHFHESASLVMWYPDDARPLVHQAYLNENDFERKLVYAKVAATLGDPVGVPTLLKKLGMSGEWDKGWNFRGMGQTGAATSPMDRLIMMLGRLKDQRSLDEIVKKAKTLTPKSEFSHFRAVSLALENIGGPTAAQTLAGLLAMPGMTGYVHDSIQKAKEFDEAAVSSNLNQDITRQRSLTEISLARALYRCGDVNGRGEAILRAYTKDLRGYFARHARKILDEKPPANNPWSFDADPDLPKGTY